MSLWLIRLKEKLGENLPTLEPSKPSKGPFECFERSESAACGGLWMISTSCMPAMSKKYARGPRNCSRPRSLRIIADGVPSAGPWDVPCEWREGYRRLLGMPSPPGFSRFRWLQVISDTKHLLDGWGARLHALGWSTYQIFGANKSIPDGNSFQAGLVVQLCGRDVLAVSENVVGAAVSCGGHVIFRCQAHPNDDEFILLWNLT